MQHYQNHGSSLAKKGYAAFILDSIQSAETYGLHHGVFSQEMFDWYARGYTPAGVEVWNAMRAIDYLITRPEVDAQKIGMTGAQILEAIELANEVKQVLANKVYEAASKMASKGSQVEKSSYNTLAPQVIRIDEVSDGCKTGESRPCCGQNEKKKQRGTTRRRGE